jgi:hypothetical protein
MSTSTIAPVSVDYTSKDFAGFKSSLLAYAASNFTAWSSRSEGDFGVLMVELFSYVGDILSYYGDRISAEAFLPTASQRLSILYLASLLGYTPSNGTPATGTVAFSTAVGGPAATVPAGTQVATDYVSALDGPIIYETTADLSVQANGATATANVVQGVTYSNVGIATATGTQSQAYTIPYLPVIDGTVQVFVEDVNGNPFPWTFEQHLFDAGPSDYVFTTFTDADDNTLIQFGDGISGAIPSAGLSITATFRIGGGISGNVAAGSITAIVSENLAGVTLAVSNGVTESSAMVGGADPESNDQIRGNAPLAYQTQNRAVTLNDYAGVALSNGAVAVANAIANHYSSVTVFVAGPGITVPPAAVLQAVQGTVQAVAMAGATVTVAGPTVVPVNFGSDVSPVTLYVLPRFSQIQVVANVNQAFQNMFSQQNVSFGMRLTLSNVYSIISNVSGVGYLTIPVMAKATDVQAGNADIVFRPGEIPSFGTITMTTTGGV